MNQFLNELKKDIQTETEDYLSQEGIMPVMMPEIDLELTPAKREPVSQQIEGNPYQEAQEELKEKSTDELLDEIEEHDFDDAESDWEGDEEVSRKGHFSSGTAEDPTELSVNLTPFDLLPYTLNGSDNPYKDWVEDNLNQKPEQVIDRIEEIFNLFPGDTPAETVFHTIQQKAEIAQDNLSQLSEPVRQVYKQVLRNRKEDAVATGVHEGAHAKFNEHYDFELPDLSEAEIDLIIDDVQDQRGGYGFTDDTIHNHWEDAIERVAGEEQAQQYREFIRMNGVNEVYARIVQKSYKQGEITELERDELYEEGIFWGQANYEGHNPFSEEGGSPGKVSGVKVQQLTDYMAENGLDSVLDMSSDQILDQFYDEDGEII